MTLQDLPLAALRLYPTTEATLLRRGVTTVAQLTQLTATDLRRAGTSAPGVARIQVALAARGLALAPGRRGQRRKKPAAKPAPAAAATKSARPAPAAAAPAAKLAPASAARPPATTIPPLPRLGRVQVRAAAPQPRTWTWAAPGARVLRSAAGRARAAVGSALIRLGERLAPR